MLPQRFNKSVNTHLQDRRAAVSRPAQRCRRPKIDLIELARVVAGLAGMIFVRPL
jgi:hypothetical protein